MKNGKTAGECGIAAKIYRAGGNNMIRWLTQIHNLPYEQKDTR